MSISSQAFEAAAQYVLSLPDAGREHRLTQVDALLHDRLGNRMRLRGLVSNHLPDVVLDVLTSPYSSVQYQNVDEGISFVVDRAVYALPAATPGRRLHSIRRSYRRYCVRKGWPVPDFLECPKDRGWKPYTGDDHVDSHSCACNG